MKEIRIYHSLWRMLPLTLGSCMFVYIGVMMFNDPFFSHKLIGIICVLFFVVALLIVPYQTIKERLTHQPYMIITDRCVIVNGFKSFVVNFSDVESFEIVRIAMSNTRQKFISIHYKPNVEMQKMEDASFFGRMLRKLNSRLSGAQEHLTTDGTSMKLQDLLDLLNERLKRA
ncbi:STM3941 family protein [Xylanibacter brevis]|uniref:STM3941 family protein n=1 Tax=Xylanibacter brevis TaxID=83231 RepID=UPI0012DE4069|nr:STM3941 family protein [Xylanibacter brevis]